MPLSSDAELARLLIATRSIALVGASHKPERPSYRVMAFLLANGYEVLPVNPGLAGQTLQGRRVYAGLSAIEVPIDMVDVFRQSHYLPGIVEEAVAARAKALWTQLDVVDYSAAETAEKAGIDVVMDRCPAIELPRLRACGLIGERC